MPAYNHVLTPGSISGRAARADMYGLMIRKKNSKLVDTGVLTRRLAQQVQSPLASVSDYSVFSRRPTRGRNFAHDEAFQRADNFTSERINQAFQNLFGPPSKPEKQDSILQQTPSFYDSRFQLKAKNVHQPETSSEGAKAGKDGIAPKLSPMNLLSSAQILRPQKQCSKASHYNQITPGQFLRQAAPVGGSNLVTVSPKDVRLFANMRR